MRLAPLTLAALLALPVAAAPVPKAPAARGDYFPLAVGHVWEYTGTCANGATRTHSIEVSRIVEKDGVRTVETESRFRFDFGGKSSDLNCTSNYRVSADGVELVNQIKTEECREQVLAARLKPGDTWHTSRPGGRSLTVEYQVGSPERVEVPAGTFVAIPVVSTNTDDPIKPKTTSWYADGVGLVKVRYDDGTESELVKFTPGK